jgi:uncharacterized low-complexity protein
MSKLYSLTSIAAVLAVSVATQPPVYAAESSALAASTKTKEGKCGVGKCGANMKTITKPASVPNQVITSATGNKAAVVKAKPIIKPMPEGKCGESKCGAKR